MDTSDWRSLALVIGGALIGFYTISFEEDFRKAAGIGWFIITLVGLAATVLFLLAYGTGAIGKQIYFYRLRNRWRNKKLGVLNDIDWDKNLSLFRWTDISPSEWRDTLLHYVEEKNLDLKIEYVTIGSRFENYAAILNPYAGMYPENDLKNYSALNKILEYVKDGGLFINVSDIPGFMAYNTSTHRIMNTTKRVYLTVNYRGQEILTSTEPYESTPMLVELGLSIINENDGLMLNLNGISERMKGMVEGNSGVYVTSRRTAIIAGNMESLITPYKTDFGVTVDTTPFFSMKYGNGEFLISLMWIKDENHYKYNAVAIRDTICTVAMRMVVDKSA